MNVIKSYAVEIEGVYPRDALNGSQALSKITSRLANFGIGWTGDGSIRYREGESSIEIHKSVTVPLHASPDDAVKPLIPLVRFLWEEFGFRQNDSCGNHIHLWFRNINTPDLMRQFIRFVAPVYLYAYYMQYRTESKYIRRLNNSMCSANRLADAVSGETRYVALNPESYREWGSLEVRLMPYAERWEEFIEMHRWTLSFFFNLFNDGIEVPTERLISVPELDVEQYVGV